MKRVGREFFQKDVLEVAPGLLGMTLVRRYEDGREERFVITDTEAYRGEEDKACHASKGRTKRTEVMYGGGGKIYVYFIYGMYWMLNFVCGEEGEPQGVLIRGLYDEENGEGISGSGRVGMRLKIDGSFYGEDVETGNRLRVEEGRGFKGRIETAARVGCDYAGEWAKKPWRFILSDWTKVKI